MVTSNRASIKSFINWRHTDEDGIKVHWLSVPYSNHMPFHKRIHSFLDFAWYSAQKAASLKGDLIFATSTPLTIAIPAVYAAKKQKIPMVFEVRDLWPELPIAIGALKGKLQIFLARQLEKFAYRYSSRIVALSPGMADGIIRCGYPREKISIIPNSADIDLFQVDPKNGTNFRTRFSWLQDRPLVVYTGTLGIINGVDYLAHLAKEVKEIAPEIRFLVVGDGFEEEKIQTLAHNLGVLNANFFMLKPLPKSEIPAILSAADLATSLFIDLPEMWANSANKFFDALASGTPVAINYQGWQADLLNETGAGIILPPHNYSEAAQLLVSFIKDKQRVKETGQKALDLANTRFHRDTLAIQLEEVLLSAVSDAKQRTAQKSIGKLIAN
jgi:glycosyltransferase involved in cell wall biosynthesis